MNTNKSFNMPTPAEIDEHITLARKMRSEFIARSVTSGWAWVRNLLSHKSTSHKAAA